MEKSFLKKIKKWDWDKILGITVLALTTLSTFIVLIVSLLLETGIISFN